MIEESPFFRFAYKPDIPVDATKYAKLFIRTQHLTTTNNKSKEKVVKKKKKPIPATIKRLVWNTHIGEEKGKSKCLCCKITDITQLSFNCGHIVAESNGGELKVSNLMPICQNCNSSMGTKNMNEFMKTLL
jgi:5-methylcytosine-specific restriction endonuclease McrA